MNKRKILAISILYLGIAQILVFDPIVPGSEAFSYKGLFGFAWLPIKLTVLGNKPDSSLYHSINSLLLMIHQSITLSSTRFFKHKKGVKDVLFHDRFNSILAGTN